jgi:hypothetical protein
MHDRPMRVETVYSAIERAGLVPRGALLVDEAERTGGLEAIRTIVLIGMAGRGGWAAFAASDEANDDIDHPLDRFSRRVIGALAKHLDAAALYPFGGPPYWPFQQWAQRAEAVHPSPIGVLIHPTYGLWHSYRGALGFAQALAVPAFEPAASPCDACAGRWCLKSCPVGAFSSEGYDVGACAEHLRNAAGAECLAGGCLARRACPVGAEHRHDREQAAFTMRAFLRARPPA